MKKEFMQTDPFELPTWLGSSVNRAVHLDLLLHSITTNTLEELVSPPSRRSFRREVFFLLLTSSMVGETTETICTDFSKPKRR